MKRKRRNPRFVFTKKGKKEQKGIAFPLKSKVDSVRNAIKQTEQLMAREHYTLTKDGKNIPKKTYKKIDRRLKGYRAALSIYEKQLKLHLDKMRKAGIQKGQYTRKGWKATKFRLAGEPLEGLKEKVKKLQEKLVKEGKLTKKEIEHKKVAEVVISSATAFRPKKRRPTVSKKGKSKAAKKAAAKKARKAAAKVKKAAAKKAKKAAAKKAKKAAVKKVKKAAKKAKKAVSKKAKKAVSKKAKKSGRKVKKSSAKKRKVSRKGKAKTRKVKTKTKKYATKKARYSIYKNRGSKGIKRVGKLIFNPKRRMTMKDIVESLKDQFYKKDSKLVLKHRVGELGGLAAGGALNQLVNASVLKYMPTLAARLGSVQYLGAGLAPLSAGLLVGFLNEQFAGNEQLELLAKGMIGASVASMSSSIGDVVVKHVFPSATPAAAGIEYSGLKGVEYDDYDMQGLEPSLSGLETTDMGYFEDEDLDWDM